MARAAEAKAVEIRRWSEVWENQLLASHDSDPPHYVPSSRSKNAWPGYSNRSGASPRDMRSLQPQPGYQWDGDWSVDVSAGVPPDGWSYATSPGQPYSSNAAVVKEKNGARRRRWIRAQISSAGTIVAAAETSIEANTAGDSEVLITSSPTAAVTSDVASSAFATPTSSESRKAVTIANKDITSSSSTTTTSITPASRTVAFNTGSSKGSYSPGAGVWLSDHWGHVYQGFRRNKHMIRWQREDLGSRHRVTKISCSRLGDVWAVTRKGQVLVRLVGRRVATELSRTSATTTPVVAVACYENERWSFGVLGPKGWSDRLLPTDGPAWTAVAMDENGNVAESEGERRDQSGRGITFADRESFTAPSERWAWDRNWAIVKKDDLTDQEGWQYSSSFSRPFHAEKTLTDLVRRRCWVRRRRVVSDAAWVSLSVPGTSPDNVGHAVSVAVSSGAGGAWVLTRAWRLFFRPVVNLEVEPEGGSWIEHPLPSHTGPAAAAAAATGTGAGAGCITLDGKGNLFVLAPDGRLHYRLDRDGADWVHLAAPRLRIFTASRSALYGVVEIYSGGNESDKLVVLRNMELAQQTANKWSSLSAPSERIVALAASREPHELWCADLKGVAYKRTGLGTNQVIGDGWHPLHVGSDEGTISTGAIVGLCSDSCVPASQASTLPLILGPWRDAIVSALEVRDAAVVAATHALGGTLRFAPMVDARASVVQSKDATLMVRRDNGFWRREVVCFNADAGVVLITGCDSSRRSGGGRRPVGIAGRISDIIIPLVDVIAVRGRQDVDDEPTMVAMDTAPTANGDGNGSGNGGGGGSNSGGGGGEANVNHSGALERYPFCFSVSYRCAGGQTAELLISALSPRDREEWLVSILVALTDANAFRREAKLRPLRPPTASSVFGIDTNGLLWYCHPEDVGLDATSIVWIAAIPCWRHASWGRLPVTFSDVSVGGGFVYALSREEGVAYCCNCHAGTVTGWERVPPPPPRADGSPSRLVKLAVQPSAVWAVTDEGHILVQLGVLPSVPLYMGSGWQRVGVESGFARVEAASGQLFAVTHSGLLVVRRGMTATRPMGTHWVTQPAGDIWAQTLPLLPTVEGITPALGAGRGVGGGVSSGKNKTLAASMVAPRSRQFAGWGGVVFALLENGTLQGARPSTQKQGVLDLAPVRGGSNSVGGGNGSTLVSLACDASGRKWGLTVSGALLIYSGEDPETVKWTQVESRSAHSDTTKPLLKFLAADGDSSNTSGSGSSSIRSKAAPVSSSTDAVKLNTVRTYVRRDSATATATATTSATSTMIQDSSTFAKRRRKANMAPFWKVSLATMLNNRDQQVGTVLASLRHCEFVLLASPVQVRDRVLTWQNHYNWIRGRIVGVRQIARPYLTSYYMVLRIDGRHVWADRGRVALDTAPPAGTIVPGTAVLAPPLHTPQSPPPTREYDNGTERGSSSSSVNLDNPFAAADVYTQDVVARLDGQGHAHLARSNRSFPLSALRVLAASYE